MVREDKRIILENDDSHETDRLLRRQPNDDSDEYQSAHEDQEEASRKEKKKKGKTSRLVTRFLNFFGVFRSSADKKKTSSSPPDDGDARPLPEGASEIERLRKENERLREKVEQYKDGYHQLNIKKEEISKVKLELSGAESDCKRMTEELQKEKFYVVQMQEMHRSEIRRLNEDFEKADNMKSGWIAQLEETIAALKRDLAIAEERAKTAETEIVQLQQKISELETVLNSNTAGVIESRGSSRPVTEL